MPLKYLFYTIVTLHILVVIGNISAFFITPFLAPWYEALPICSFILLISFSQELKCPLTRLENSIRVKIGKKRIGGFVGHYFVRPIRNYLKKKDPECLRFHGQFSANFPDKPVKNKRIYQYAIDIFTKFAKFQKKTS